jgi:hypothetical protein
MPRTDLNIDSVLVLNFETGSWAEMLVPQDMCRTASIRSCEELDESPDIEVFDKVDAFGRDCRLAFSRRHTVFSLTGMQTYWSISDSEFVSILSYNGLKFDTGLSARLRSTDHMIVAILVCFSGNYSRLKSKVKALGFEEYQRGRLSER